jgi:hypothetical protein
MFICGFIAGLWFAIIANAWGNYIYRKILVDKARERESEKINGQWVHLSIALGPTPCPDQAEEVASDDGGSGSEAD